MKHLFNRFSREERGSAAVDWTVLLTGILLLVLSVAPVVTAKADTISGDTLDRVAPAEDWLPS